MCPQKCGHGFIYLVLQEHYHIAEFHITTHRPLKANHSCISSHRIIFPELKHYKIRNTRSDSFIADFPCIGMRCSNTVPDLCHYFSVISSVIKAKSAKHHQPEAQGPWHFAWPKKCHSADKYLYVSVIYAESLQPCLVYDQCFLDYRSIWKQFHQFRILRSHCS